MSGPRGRGALRRTMSTSALPLFPEPLVIPSRPAQITEPSTPTSLPVLNAHQVQENAGAEPVEDVQEGIMHEFFIPTGNTMHGMTEETLPARPASGASAEVTEPFPEFDQNNEDYQPPSLLYQAQEAAYEHRLGEIANELRGSFAQYPPRPPRHLRLADYRYRASVGMPFEPCSELVHYNHFCLDHEFKKVALHEEITQLLNADSDLPTNTRELFSKFVRRVVTMEDVCFSRRNYRRQPCRYITTNELLAVFKISCSMLNRLVRLGHKIAMLLNRAKIALALVKQVAARRDLYVMEKFRQMAEIIMEHTVKMRRPEQKVFEVFAKFYDGYFFHQFHLMFNHWLVERIPDVDSRLEQCSYLVTAAYHVIDQFTADYRNICKIITRIKLDYIHPLVEVISRYPPRYDRMPAGAIYHVYAVELGSLGPNAPFIVVGPFFDEPEIEDENPYETGFALGPELVFPHADADADTNDARTDVSVFGSSSRSSSPMTLSPHTYAERFPIDVADSGPETEIPTDPEFPPNQDSGYGDSSGYNSDYEPTEVMSDSEFDRCLASARQAEAEAQAQAEVERSQTLDFSSEGQNDVTATNGIAVSPRQRSLTTDSYVENPHALFLDPEEAEPTDLENVIRSFANHFVEADTTDSYVENPHALFLDPEQAEFSDSENVIRGFANHPVEANTTDSYGQYRHTLFEQPEQAEHSDSHSVIRCYAEDLVEDSQKQEDDDETFTTDTNVTVIPIGQRDSAEDQDAWLVAPNPYEVYIEAPLTPITRPSPSRPSSARTSRSTSTSTNTQRLAPIFHIPTNTNLTEVADAAAAEAADASLFHTMHARIETLGQVDQFERANPYTDTETMTRVYNERLPEFARHRISEVPFVATRSFLPPDYDQVVAARASAAGRAAGRGAASGVGNARANGNGSARGRRQPRANARAARRSPGQGAVDRRINPSPLLPPPPRYPGHGQNQPQQQAPAAALAPSVPSDHGRVGKRRRGGRRA